jgi:hypothetical protein
MRSPLRFAAVLGLGLLAAPPAAAQDTAWPLYRNEKFGFELRYPPAFVVGAYEESLPPDLAAKLKEGGGSLPFEHAIALVEPARLGRANPSELPPGDVTTITIQPHTGSMAQSVRRLGRTIYPAGVEEVKLGTLTALKFPGYPGPYGAYAFYYLVPVSDDTVIAFSALRKFREKPEGDTGYDRLIEQIIATLRLFPPKP